MNEHHTKEKGDLGVLKAQADLAEQGYVVLVPCSEHQPFDIVAYNGTDFKRIQVKYRTMKEGVIPLALRSCWSDSRGVHTAPIDRTQVDIVCIYCPDTRECYYIPIGELSSSVILRVDPPKNNQTKGVRLASDYRRVP